MNGRVVACAAVLCMLAGCEAKQKAAPPQLSWQEFVRDAGKLDALLTSSVECLDGQDPVQTPGLPSAFVPPCVYETPVSSHGYRIKGATFDRQGHPYVIGVEFAVAQPVEKIAALLDMDALGALEPVKRLSGHTPVTYARWYNRAAGYLEPWKLDALKLEDGTAKEVKIYINPFQDIAQKHRLLIASGFPVIDPDHVPPVVHQPGLKRQEHYAASVRVTRQEVQVNRQTVWSSDVASGLFVQHAELGGLLSARLGEVVKRQQKRAKLLAQPAPERVHVDAAQDASFSDLFGIVGVARKLGAVDLSVSKLPTMRADLMTHGEARLYELPPMASQVQESWAEHLVMRVRKEGVDFKVGQSWKVPAESCEEESCWADGAPRAISVSGSHLDMIKAAAPEQMYRALRRAFRENEALKGVVVEVHGDEVPLQLVMGLLDVATLKVKPSGSAECNAEPLAEWTWHESELCEGRRVEHVYMVYVP